MVGQWSFGAHYLLAENNCLFYISAENGQSDWLEYWSVNLGDWGNMSNKLTDTLSEFGLYAEWVNAGLVAIYPE